MAAPTFDFAGALKAGASPQDITNFLSSKGQGNLATTYFNLNPNPNTGSNAFTDPITALKNYVTNVAQDDYKNTQDMETNVQEAGTPGKNGQLEQKSIPEMLLQNSGDVVSSVFAPITEAIKPIVQAASNGLANNSTVQKIANSGAGAAVDNATTGASSAYQQWAQSNPEQAKNLEAAVNVIMGITGEQAQDPITNALKSAGSAAADAITPAADAAASTAPESAAPSTDDILASRTADATPAYSKSMVGQFVQNPEGDAVPRVNEGEGLTGNRTVTTSKGEASVGQELANIKDYPDNGTALQKSQAVYKEISSEAQSMRTGLQAEDQANPLNATAEQAKVKALVMDNMPEDVQKSIAAGKPLPKTAAGRYYQAIIDATDKYDGTRVGKLDLRQTMDSAYENARGKLAFGSDTQNALDEAHTDIRNAVNKDLADTTKNTDTQASLTKQSKLYRAKDVLDKKAAAEATSKTGRFMQKHPQAQFISRMGERQLVRIPLEIGAGALGLKALENATSKK